MSNDGLGRGITSYKKKALYDSTHKCFSVYLTNEIFEEVEKERKLLRMHRNEYFIYLREKVLK